MNYFLYEQADLLHNLLFVFMSFAKEDACHGDVMAVPPTTHSTDLASEDNSQDDLGYEPPTTDDLETQANIVDTKFTYLVGENCWKCDCVVKIKAKRHRAAHLTKMHSNEKQFNCSNEGCSKSFSMKSDCKSHEDRVHSELEKTKCHTCERLYKMKYHRKAY